MIRQVFVCCALACGLSSLRAQQKTRDSLEVQELDEVVVSDSRFALKREYSGKTVIRIGPEELAHSQGKSLAELLSFQSGIEISGSRGRPGEVLGVYARGGRGRQVVVLIDGIRVTDPSSSSQEFDLRLLPLDQVASIEILKGASSTLYGTNAAAAVISITTRQAGDRPFGLTASSSLGTNQASDRQDYSLASFANNARIGGVLGPLEYSAGISQAYSGHLSSLDTPGREEDPFSRYQADVRLGFRVNRAIKLSIHAARAHFSSEYDEAFGQTDAPYVYTTDQNRAGAALTTSYPRGEVKVNAGFAEFNSINQSAFPGEFTGRSLVADAYNKYTLGKSLYSLVGISYISDRAEFGEPREFRLLDPYLNMVYVSDFGLNLNAGGRLNTHSEYGDQWVYNINPSYTFKGKEDGYLKLMGTLATSYLTPSLTQLFGDFGANPDLEPETDRTLEAGLEWAGDHSFRVSALYFNRREEHFVFFDGSQSLYRNASGTVHAGGLELETHWEPLKNLHFEANYTYTERKGDNAIRIPKHKVNSELGVQLSPAIYAAVQYSYTGVRPDTDFFTFTDVDLEAFSLVNFYISRELMGGKLKVYLDAENLFNARYTEVLGYLSRGRNFQAGFTLQL